VRCDDFETGRLVARHLISLGHREIGYISGPNVSSSRLRQAGFTAQLKEHGISFRDEWTLAGDFTTSTGYEAMRKLLRRESQPTAVFAANDPMAVGAVRACWDVGLDVPGDISVIGAGCIENSSYPAPFLTTVDWSRRELGAEAARILVNRVSGGKWPDNLDITYRPSLLVRKSTGPARRPARLDQT
jgi:DNA-binding LacI/PurR family transcriptional regulator